MATVQRPPAQHDPIYDGSRIPKPIPTVLQVDPAIREGGDVLTVNFGPNHPSTHGVLRLILTLEGEMVRDVKPIIGYVHTGIEKTAEQKAYWKVIPVVERMDYLSYYFNAMAYCGAVEKLLDIERMICADNARVAVQVAQPRTRMMSVMLTPIRRGDARMAMAEGKFISWVRRHDTKLFATLKARR
jgi:hypothetical protein